MFNHNNIKLLKGSSILNIYLSIPIFPLCRENDLLREQLKRYVGMVQQLQQGEEHEKIVSKKLSEVFISSCDLHMLIT